MSLAIEVQTRSESAEALVQILKVVFLVLYNIKRYKLLQLRNT